MSLLRIVAALTLATPLAAQQTPAPTAARNPVQDSSPRRDLTPSEGFTNMGTISTAAETPLNYDYSVNPFSLLTASVRFSDDGTKQKLNFTPLKLRGDRRSWDGLTLNLVNSGGSATFGLGATLDQAASYSGRFEAAADRFSQRPVPVISRLCTLSNGDIDERCAEMEMLKDYENYWSRVMANSLSLTFSGNLQTFSGLAATKVDLDNDGKIDNQYTVKAYEGSATLLYRASLRVSGSVTGRYSERRSSAVQDTPLLPYYGATATASRVFAILDPSYLTSKGFRSSLFIPSIAGGASLEFQHCNGAAAACEKKIKEQWIFTPFIDVRLGGGTQFRLGAPIRRDRIGDKEGVRVEPLAQLGFALAGL